MKNILKSVCCVIFASFLIGAVSARANSDFDSWKHNFYRQAQKAGISQKTLDKAIPQMHLLERVIRLDTEKPEFVSNFYDYIGRRLSTTRIAMGQNMAKKYPTWLAKIESQYGVPKSYLLALWGMETNYGTFMGNVNMLDSLATLAYHPRRRKFFTNELIAYLRIVDQEPSVAPIKGSWDGGFGHFQFMPTTFWAYAVDGDGNGRRDLVNNIPDALASAANYLNHMGWNPDEPWGREVILPTDFDWTRFHQIKGQTVAEWEKAGVAPMHLAHFPKKEHNTMAELHIPMGGQGPVFLTYPNFKIIMRWNKLSLYALAVGLMADVLEGHRDSPVPPENFKPFRTVEIICLQDKLQEQGYSTGGTDGQIGPKTRRALARYQKDQGYIPDAYPTHDLIEKMGCHYDEN